MFSLRAVALGKTYQAYRRPIDSLKELFFKKDCGEVDWAVRDVSFEVQTGGSLGIVGDNGAGKSTLLRLIAGAASPTAGRIERQGRVSAILELGAGFHPELSGRENLRIGCAALGLSPRETATMIPAIIAFSELGTAIDRPVRTYSSGMYLRLGFAVATVIEPNILVVDEHLSVGDLHFRYKCMRRIAALRQAGCSLVLCSHSLYTVREVCERTLWLRDGRPAMLGETGAVLDVYQDYVRARETSTETSDQALTPSPKIADNYLDTIVLHTSHGGARIATYGSAILEITAHLSALARREGVHVGVLITRNDGVWCYGTSTRIDGLDQGMRNLGNGRYGVRLVLDPVPLLSGLYSFTVSLMDSRSPLVFDTRSGAAPFEVRHGGQEVGVAEIAHRWEFV